MRGRGSFEKYTTKSGTGWRIVFDQGKDPTTGKRRQTTRRGFRTKAEATKEMNRIASRVDEGTYVIPSPITFGEYLLRVWLPKKQPKKAAVQSGRGNRGRVGVGTWATYKGDIEAYIIPHMGGIDVGAVTASHIDGLYNALEESGKRRAEGGLSAKTLANLHGVIHLAFADAVEMGLIARNPADLVEPPRPGKPRTQAWELPHLRAFVERVAVERLYAGWLLFATNGLRRGEVAGLAWPDLDLNAPVGRLTVEWTLGAVDSRHELGRKGKAAQPTWKPAKSANSERALTLDPVTVAALRAWRKRQAEERLLAGPAWETRNIDWRGNYREDLVFTWPDGRMIHPDRWTDWFLELCQQTNLPRIRLHDVRHSYATAGLRIAKNLADVRVLADRLGHSVDVFLKTYAHALPAADEEATLSLAQIILG